MIFKPPPSGQSCANCLCFDGERCRAHMDPHSAITNDGAPMLGWWCGHWRGNAEVDCGGCKHFGTTLCPRVLFTTPHNGELMTRIMQAPTAFACERYEEDKP